MNKHTITDLYQMQSLPLRHKITMTKQRIRGWYEHWDGNVYVSFSGGKDSTVLLDIVRQMYPDVPAVFVDTGLEYPEIREFVKTFDNVTWLKPKMNFRQVIEKYGYPIISKDVAQCLYDVTIQAQRNECNKRETKLWNRAFNPESEYAKKYQGFSRAKYDFLNDAPFLISHRCCDVIKKKPSKAYEKETSRKPIMATMASESRLRTTQWLQDGCNAFEVKRPTSKPISFWTEQDILLYIKENHIPICSVYGDIVEDRTTDPDAVEGQMTISDMQGFENMELFDAKRLPLKTTGCERTGCMFCMFGCSSPKWENFARMKETHPQVYDYIMRPKSEGGLNYKDVIDWINEHGDMDIRY